MATRNQYQRPESFSLTETEFRYLLEPTPTPRAIKPGNSNKFSNLCSKTSETTNSFSITPVDFHKSDNSFNKIANKSSLTIRNSLAIAQKSVRSKKSNPTAVFKTHAIYLNKEEFQKIHKNNEPKVIHESMVKEINRVKELIECIMDQADSIPLKSFRGLIKEIYQKISNLSVDIEAKTVVLIGKYDEKVEDLMQQIKKYEQSCSVQEKQVIDSLIQKNVSLSSHISDLEKTLTSSTAKVQQLESNLKLMTDQATLSLKIEEENRCLSTENSVEDSDLKIPKTNNQSKSSLANIISILDWQLKSKDAKISKLLLENESLKSSSKQNNLKRVHIQRHQVNYPSTPKSDLVSFLSCMALTVEDLLI